MAQDNTVERLLEIVVETEEYARDFYKALEKKFSHVPKVAEFFTKMARDEDNHAKTMIGIKDSLDADALGGPAHEDILNKAKEAYTYKTSNRLKLDIIKTLNDAFDEFEDFEKSEVNQVYTMVLKHFLNPDEQRMALAHLQAHLGMLKDFSEKYDTRKRKEIELK